MWYIWEAKENLTKKEILDIWHGWSEIPNREMYEIYKEIQKFQIRRFAENNGDPYEI